MIKLLAVMLAALSLLPAAAGAAPEAFTFTGKVEGSTFTPDMQGSTAYSHELPDGLTFKLVSEEEGWKISVSDGKHETCKTRGYNCNDLASTSQALLGVNVRNIYGWQFMQNGKGNPKNVMGTIFTLERVFDYAPDRKTLARIMASDDCVKNAKPDCENIDALRLRKGVLSIQSYKPFISADGKNLTIKNMQFTVTVYPPTPAKDQLNPIMH